MRGRVVWYRPRVGVGMIASDTGAEVSFHVDQSQMSLQGGDVVEFEPKPNGQRVEAGQIRLIESGVDHLNSQHRSLVNEFHSVVEIVH